MFIKCQKFTGFEDVSGSTQLAFVISVLHAASYRDDNTPC